MLTLPKLFTHKFTSIGGILLKFLRIFYGTAPWILEVIGTSYCLWLLLFDWLFDSGKSRLHETDFLHEDLYLI